MAIEGIVKELIEFQPTAAQEKAKAAFMVAISGNPLIDLRKMSGENAARLAGNTSITTWWKKPGFKEWFTNEDSWRAQLLYLTTVALRTLENVLLDDNPRSAAARVNAAKLILEAANKMPSKTKEVRYLDKSVENKSEAELKKMIEEAQELLTGGEVIDGD